MYSDSIDDKIFSFFDDVINWDTSERALDCVMHLTRRGSEVMSDLAPPRRLTPRPYASIDVGYYDCSGENLAPPPPGYDLAPPADPRPSATLKRATATQSIGKSPTIA